MSGISKRLDDLRNAIQQDDFLEGKGLSNEVNIRMFCYEPKEEMIVRHFLDQLANDHLNCRIVHYDLYEVFLKICEQKRILDRIPKLEEKRGKEILEKQFMMMCDSKTFVSMLKYDNETKRDVIILSGVGKVFPFMRVHSLLEAMQPMFSVPIVVLYPGTFDGHYLKLFNKLKANEYYRAFNSL